MSMSLHPVTGVMIRSRLQYCQSWQPVLHKLWSLQCSGERSQVQKLLNLCHSNIALQHLISTGKHILPIFTSDRGSSCLLTLEFEFHPKNFSYNWPPLVWSPCHHRACPRWPPPSPTWTCPPTYWPASHPQSPASQCWGSWTFPTTESLTLTATSLKI